MADKGQAPKTGKTKLHSASNHWIQQLSSRPKSTTRMIGVKQLFPRSTFFHSSTGNIYFLCSALYGEKVKSAELLINFSQSELQLVCPKTAVKSDGKEQAVFSVLQDGEELLSGYEIQVSANNGNQYGKRGGKHSVQTQPTSTFS